MARPQPLFNLKPGSIPQSLFVPFLLFTYPLSSGLPPRACARHPRPRFLFRRKEEKKLREGVFSFFFYLFSFYLFLFLSLFLFRFFFVCFSLFFAGHPPPPDACRRCVHPSPEKENAPNLTIQSIDVPNSKMMKTLL